MAVTRGPGTCGCGLYHSLPSISVYAVDDRAFWETGREFEDLELWETEMEDMGRRFGISS